tara:strand:+ start:6890 stop:7270 length:381 start_codon:yes stop_codon:yes gene_type:complete
MFEGTLVDTEASKDEYLSQHPTVTEGMLSEDPDIASDAILYSLPIVPKWKQLANLKGEHWVITFLPQEALELWITLWQGHPELGPIVNGIARSLSLSTYTREEAVRYLRQQMAEYPTIEGHGATIR